MLGNMCIVCFLEKNKTNFFGRWDSDFKRKKASSKVSTEKVANLIYLIQKIVCSSVSNREVASSRILNKKNGKQAALNKKVKSSRI